MSLYQRWGLKLTEYAAHETAHDLKQECDARWYVVLLSQSQVLGKEVRLDRGVICEACEVEVGEWPAREKIASQHLTDGLYVEAKSGEAILSTKEEGKNESEAQCKEIPPPRQG